MKAALLFLISFSAVGAPSFDQVFQSMNKVDRFETLETSYATPLYRKLQFELRSGRRADLEIGEAGRFGVKLSPLAWGQRSAERDLNLEYGRLSKTLNDEGAGRECLYRSLLFANSYHTLKTIKLLKRLNQHYEDQNKILKRGIGENLFEFKELLSVREAHIKNRLKIMELEKLLQAIEVKLNQRLSSEVRLSEIDFKNFITVKKIKQNATAVEPKTIELEKLSSMARINQLELDIEKKEGDQFFDSVEMYRWADRYGPGVYHGVRLTFNIPFFNKKSYMRDAVQRQVAINKMSASQRDIISELEGTQLEFLNKIEQYEAMVDSDYFKTLKSLKKLLSGSRNNSPLMIIQTKTKMVSERLKLLDLKHEITKEYLDKLFYTGQISSCSTPSFLVKN